MTEELSLATEGEKNMIGAKCDLKDKFAMRFLTTDGEQLVYSTRQHWTQLMPATGIIIGGGIPLLMLLAAASIFTVSYPLYFFVVGLVLLTLGIIILIRQVIEWFFHFYIVTDKKIVEVTYRPLQSNVMNEVILDQVRCTEVDIETHGVMNQFFNVGTVLITFDRPTHEQVFTIENIKDPRMVAMHLADSFGTQKYQDTGLRSMRDERLADFVYRPSGRFAYGNK